jgi:hypothetical protein
VEDYDALFEPSQPFSWPSVLGYLIRPERQNISVSRSKGRAYAMIAIGLALSVMSFT